MNILLAVDGSRHAQAAVDEIVRRPWPRNSTVRLLAVVPPVVPAVVEPLGAALWDRLWREQTFEAERLLVRAAASFSATPLSIEQVIRRGDPPTEIVAEASASDADLIVVGSHGRSEVEHLQLGSVAHSVMNHADCSVEVVRHTRGTLDGYDRPRRDDARSGVLQPAYDA